MVHWKRGCRHVAGGRFLVTDFFFPPVRRLGAPSPRSRRTSGSKGVPGHLSLKGPRLQELRLSGTASEWEVTRSLPVIRRDSCPLDDTEPCAGAVRVTGDMAGSLPGRLRSLPGYGASGRAPRSRALAGALPPGAARPRRAPPTSRLYAPPEPRPSAGGPTSEEVLQLAVTLTRRVVRSRLISSRDHRFVGRQRSRHRRSPSATRLPERNEVPVTARPYR